VERPMGRMRRKLGKRMVVCGSCCAQHLGIDHAVMEALLDLLPRRWRASLVLNRHRKT
jgi:hypothetical protein